MASNSRLSFISSSVLAVLFLTYILNLLSMFENPHELRQELTSTAATLKSKLFSTITSTNCNPKPKPNLVLTAIDGPKWQDQIFVFLESLEHALARDALETQRANNCPNAPVCVRILAPKEVTDDLAPAFEALLRRYRHVEFVGILPEIPGVRVVWRRFLGWSAYLDSVSSIYNNVLACDLDVVFQRNPFTQPMDSRSELRYYAEWRGLKLGQDMVHWSWFEECATAEGGPYITPEQHAAYRSQDRFCAGSVYGTERAMQVYMDTMATCLSESHYRCNDQAMHIHLYYSGILNRALREKGIGGVSVLSDDKTLLGSVGTTPMILFNEWGEILNELGEVQVAVHQYKHHHLLTDIVWRKYAYMADPGLEALPAFPKMLEDLEYSSAIEQEWRTRYPGVGSFADKENQKHWGDNTLDLQRYLLKNTSTETCGLYDKLCSCKWADCQMHYNDYWVPVPGFNVPEWGRDIVGGASEP